ncbi:MAG: TrkA family potassium uptake protein [Pseudanabaenaceae cyanobacterium bins.68]|nr:TrkA family potassium uptake protein [Pseudanabaenaceae cyanobacterium bins.68]
MNIFRRKSLDNRHFAVLGLGRFGKSVCKTLLEGGFEVLGVDRNESLVDHVIAEHPSMHCVQVDTTDLVALQDLGIAEFDTVIVAIGNFLEESIITTLHVKEAGVRYVVAKASSEVHGTLLKKVGADRVVYPEAEMGSSLARSLTQLGILERLELDKDNSIVEVAVPEVFAGKSIVELQLRNNFGVNVLAIREGGKYEVNPSPDRKLKKGGLLVLIGDNKSIQRLPLERITQT